MLRSMLKTWRQSLMRYAFYSETGLLELFYYFSYWVGLKDLICLRVFTTYSALLPAVFLSRRWSAFLTRSVILTSHGFHCSISPSK